MSSEERLNRKLLQLKQNLDEIGYVPTQKENRALNLNIKYYYKNYPDNPIINELVKKYPLPTSNRRPYIKNGDIDSRLEEIEHKLKELGRVPMSKEDTVLLHEIERYYKKYPEHPNVNRLMHIYPTSSVYSKWSDMLDDNSDVKNPCTRAMKYIKYCIDKYNELPGVRTNPMHLFYKQLKTSYRRTVDREVLEFARYLIEERSIRDSCLIQTYYESSIDEPFIYDRLSSIMDRHKIVTLGYLSRNLVPGIKLSTKILFHYFYYQDQNKAYPYAMKEGHRHRFRLFETCNGDGGIVSVGFDELIKLDFDKIAKSIPFDILPEYTSDIDNETDLLFAKAFLFHHDLESHIVGNELYYTNKINFCKTIFDDLAEGICPIKFLRNGLFYDNQEISIDWCLLLIGLNSPLIKNYIDKCSLSFNDMNLSDLYKEKVCLIKNYVREKYDYIMKNW